MALSDLISRARTIVYGSGLGEKPAVRVGAASANETTTNQLCTFALDTNEGAKVKPGNILSVYDPSTEADAHAFYVTGVSGDTITAINGYLGSPVIVGSDSGDLDNALFEQNPMVTGYEIFEAIDTVFSNLLWPQVYDMVTASITTPDLVDGQEAVAAEAEEIVSAWQISGSTIYQVPATRIPYEVHTTVATTGKLAAFDWIDSSTGYYTYRAKFTESDETDTELTQLVATGAAAILLGASVSETTLESTKKENQGAVSQRSAAGASLWRDFLTLRQSMSEELSKRLPSQIYVNRG